MGGNAARGGGPGGSGGKPGPGGGPGGSGALGAEGSEEAGSTVPALDAVCSAQNMAGPGTPNNQKEISIVKDFNCHIGTTICFWFFGVPGKRQNTHKS